LQLRPSYSSVASCSAPAGTTVGTMAAAASADQRHLNIDVGVSLLH
jgi:hypothetical protein